jgi:voltage-gated potassium channel
MKDTSGVKWPGATVFLRSRGRRGLVRGEVKRRVHEILTTPRPGDRVGRLFSFLLLTLIATNVLACVLETDQDIRAQAPRFFVVFEWVSVAVFSVEYVLRLWSCTADPRFQERWGRLRWSVTPMALVDLVAIAPSLIQFLLPGAIDLRFLRVLRLMRLFRLLRFGRLGYAFSTLARVIHTRRVELGVTLAFVMVATIIAAGAIYLVEHGQADTGFSSIPRAMWWAVVTITTVGYGDMVPQTALGHVIGGIVAFVGICALALPVGILSSGFIEELSRQQAEAKKGPAATCPHCGGLLDEKA